MSKVNPNQHDRAIAVLKGVLQFRASMYSDVPIKFPDDMHFTFRVTEQHVHIFIVKDNTAVTISDDIIAYPSNKLIAELALIMEGTSLPETIRATNGRPT